MGSGKTSDASWINLLIVEISVRLALAVIGFAFDSYYTPFVRRTWPSEWKKYAFPYVETEMFPMLSTMLLSLALSFLMLLIVIFLLRKFGEWPRRKLARTAGLFLLGSSLAIGCGFVVCEIIKRMYGRLRPDFLARCLGPRTLEAWLNEWGLVGLEDIPEIPDCSHSPLDPRQLEDGRMSFPSEHACLTSALMFFDALWLHHHVSRFPNSGALRIAAPFAMTVFPIMVAISRTSDYRHHASDVAAGFLIGIVIAVICFALYFPITFTPCTFPERGEPVLPIFHRIPHVPTNTIATETCGFTDKPMCSRNGLCTTTPRYTPAHQRIRSLPRRVHFSRKTENGRLPRSPTPALPLRRETSSPPNSFRITTSDLGSEDISENNTYYLQAYTRR